MNNNGKVGGAFCIDDARAEESISAKRRVAADLNDKKSGVRTNFATLYNIGKFTTGLNGMQRGMAEIAGEFEYISNIDQSFVNEGMYADASLSKKADELFISHDFVGNNSMEINSYNKSILGKVDGTSVNAGEKTLTNAHVDEKTKIAKKQSLTDLTTGATVEQHAKDIEGITKEDKFADVTKGATTEQHAKDIEGITREDSFGNINKESDVSVRKIDEGTTVQEKSLGSINKDGGTLEQHIKAEYGSVQNKQLGDISRGNLGSQATLQMNVGEMDKVAAKELNK